ncbi:MAG: ribonuclease P protein component [Pseudomonadota bacterium]
MSGGLGFSRRQRLLKAAEYEAVFEHRCAVRTTYFQVLAKPNELGQARLGMIVSKRLFPHAVDRNRERRRIRETFRQMAANLPALDLVVRPQQTPDGNTPCQAQIRDLRNALAKAALKCFPAC